MRKGLSWVVPLVLLAGLARGSCDFTATCVIPDYFTRTQDNLYVVEITDTNSGDACILENGGPTSYLTGSGQQSLIEYAHIGPVFPKNAGPRPTAVSDVHSMSRTPQCYTGWDGAGNGLGNLMSFVAEANEGPVLVVERLRDRANSPDDAFITDNYAIQFLSPDHELLAYGGFVFAMYQEFNFEGGPVYYPYHAATIMDIGDGFPSIQLFSFPTLNGGFAPGWPHLDTYSLEVPTGPLRSSSVVDPESCPIGPRAATVDPLGVNAPVSLANWGNSKMKCDDGCSCVYVGDGPQGGLGFLNVTGDCSATGYKVVDMPGAVDVLSFGAVNHLGSSGVEFTYAAINATHLLMVDLDVSGAIPSVSRSSVVSLPPGPAATHIAFTGTSFTMDEIAIARGSRVEIHSVFGLITPGPPLDAGYVMDAVDGATDNWCEHSISGTLCHISSMSAAVLEVGANTPADLLLSVSSPDAQPLALFPSDGRAVSWNGTRGPMPGEPTYPTMHAVVPLHKFEVFGSPPAFTVAHLGLVAENEYGETNTVVFLNGLVRFLEEDYALFPRSLLPNGVDAGAPIPVTQNPIRGNRPLDPGPGGSVKGFYRGNGAVTLVFNETTYVLDTNTTCCGNGERDIGEICDSSDAVYFNHPVWGLEEPVGPTFACPANCAGSCADGIMSGTEPCDGSALDSDDPDECAGGSTLPQCFLPECGDGIVTSPVETCDTMANDTLPGGALCQDDCGYCGDGRRTGAEECDDDFKDDFTPNACRTDCSAPTCGDGVIDTTTRTKDGFFEECDDANLDEEDGCYSNCTLKPAVCGDLIVHPILEDCDEGGLNSNDRVTNCTLSCKFPTCGDGLFTQIRDSDDVNGTYVYSELCDPTAEDDDLAAQCFSDCTFGSEDPAQVPGVAAGMALFLVLVGGAACYLKRVDDKHAAKRDAQFGFKLRLGQAALETKNLLKSGISRRRLLGKKKPAPPPASV